MNFYLPTPDPTKSQKKMNNGMTVKKMRILTLRADDNSKEARHGRISWTKAYTMNVPIYRDIRILGGEEKAFLQG